VAISEEERARRSKLAKQLNAAGKFGGAQPGSGRPKGSGTKQRIAAQVSEKLQKNADEIYSAIVDGLSPNQPASVRINAAKEALKIERDEAELVLKEERALEDLTTAQLLEMVSSRLLKIGNAGALPSGLQDIIDLPSEEEDG
jgi:DNA-binding protein YbaB